jgi:transposase
MRTGISLSVTFADRARLRALVIRFLNAIDREVPAGKTVHAILDNYAAHKHPVVRQWLAHNPRWTFHFTPTSASWLNAVEGFFATLAKPRLKRRVFRQTRTSSVRFDALVAA